MEIQCPFQIAWEVLSPDESLARFLFKRFKGHEQNLALIDSYTKAKWRYGELHVWVERCMRTLKAMGLVERETRVGLIHRNCPQVIILHLACSMLAVTCVCIDAEANNDEMGQLVDMSDAMFLVTQPQYVTRLEDLSKKSQLRGGGRPKTIVLLSDVVSAKEYSAENDLDIQNDAAVRKASQMKSAHTSNDSATAGGSEPSRGTNNTPPADTKANGVAVPAIAVGTAGENRKRGQSMANLKKTTSSNKLNQLQIQTPQRLQRMKSTGDFQASMLTTNPVEQCCMLFFTSGTTGLPKPVELSHASLLINMQQMSAMHFNPPTSRDPLLCEVALHHIYGSMIVYYGLYNGCQVIVMPEHHTTEELCKTISDYKVTRLLTTGTTLSKFSKGTMIEQMVARGDLSSLQSITVAGAPLDLHMAEKSKKRLKLKDLRQSFGMTELSGAATWSRYGSANLQSVGTPLPGMLMKQRYCFFSVVNIDTREICPPNTGGELLVKGPQVTPTFYKNPRAKLELVEREGWIKTGDYGWYDEDGYIYVADRIKDLIRHRGSQICPSELESMLRIHAGIEDCAIVGRSDHVSGEVPAAFVVRAATHTNLTTADVRQHCTDSPVKITGFKELRGGVFFVGDVPRSASGKVKRRQIRQQWERGKGVASSGGDSQAVSANSSPKTQIRGAATRGRGGAAIRGAR